MSVRYVDKPCARCGMMLHTIPFTTKYCPGCRREIRNQRESTRRYRVKSQCKKMPVICEGCGVTFRSPRMNPPKKCPECREKDAKFARRAHERKQGEATETAKHSENRKHRKMMPWEQVGRTNPGRRYGRAVADALLEQQRQEMEARRREYEMKK